MTDPFPNTSSFSEICSSSVSGQKHSSSKLSHSTYSKKYNHSRPCLSSNKLCNNSELKHIGAASASINSPVSVVSDSNSSVAKLSSIALPSPSCSQIISASLNYEAIAVLCELPPACSQQNVASSDAPSGNAGALCMNLHSGSSVGGAGSAVRLTKGGGSFGGEDTTGSSFIVPIIQCYA